MTCPICDNDDLDNLIFVDGDVVTIHWQCAECGNDWFDEIEEDNEEID